MEEFIGTLKVAAMMVGFAFLLGCMGVAIIAPIHLFVVLAGIK